MGNRFFYSVEMFKCWDGEDTKPYWGKDIRLYQADKKLTDFDLIDVPNKRRNAKFIKSLFNTEEDGK